MTDEATEPINYISAQEFRDGGYLQEANRLFFHPLGLALEMHWKDGDDKAMIRGIWDYRDDPEGINFVFESEEQEEEFYNKAEAIRFQWGTRRRPRVEELRYMVQPSAAHERELHSDIMRLFGDALGMEMSKVIPVKATSESWQTAMRGVFDKVCLIFADEPYNPQVVSPEEVHTMDLVLGLEVLTGARTRIEALNMLADRARFYKDVFDDASAALASIAKGDFPPGMSPQDFAIEALSSIAGELGG